MLGAIGCQRTKPQAPANRHKLVDSTEMAQVLMTQRLVEEANIQVAQYANTSDAAHVFTEQGYWYRIVTHTQNDIVRKEQRVIVRMVVHDLKGKLLFDNEQLVMVGKHDIPASVDLFLQQMRIGERASLLLPWYAAYGALGNDLVPAYANIRMEIEIIE